MANSFEKRCVAVLDELELAQPQQIGTITPLTGGVASDIARIETENGDFCVKFALAKLKVKEDWHAPVHRNAAEYAWLQVASQMAPGYFPTLFGRSLAENGFVMEFIDGDDIYNWKQSLLERGPIEGEARSVANLLGRIHQGSAKPGFDSTAFQNSDDFEALRLEPYLRFTASRHPTVADVMNTMANDIYASKKVLVHGDVSPKNIMFRNGDPVVLDAECATMGDPAFDVAFCLNHLVLKAFHMPEYADKLLQDAADFEAAYFSYVDWEDKDQLNDRLARLLPMMMLARVDGKSPLEYLGTEQQDQVRDLTLHYISNPITTLGALFSKIKEAITS